MYSLSPLLYIVWSANYCTKQCGPDMTLVTQRWLQCGAFKGKLTTNIACQVLVIGSSTHNPLKPSILCTVHVDLCVHYIIAMQTSIATCTNCSYIPVTLISGSPLLFLTSLTASSMLVVDDFKFSGSTSSVKV